MIIWFSTCFHPFTHHAVFLFKQRKSLSPETYEVPELARTAKGTPVINLIEIDQEERIEVVIPVKEFTPNEFLFSLSRRKGW